jgi:hypothetical protein
MLQTLKESLIAVRAGRMYTDRLIAVWRDQAALLDRHPQRYCQVLDDFFMRIESSRLFSSGARAFDGDDLIGSLASWLNKADDYLSQEKDCGRG